VIPWRKHWRTGESTPPRQHASRIVGRVRAMRELDAANELHGADHPATRAARGRYLYYLGSVPQRGAESPEAVAWFRESGISPGYLNRARRRSLLDKAPPL